MIPKRSARLLSLLLTLSLFLTFAPPARAQAASSGKCGPNVYWEVNGDTLTIQGSGPMNSFSNQEAAYSAPWAYGSTSNFKTCIIKSGVTTLGSQSFFNCIYVNKLYIPRTVTHLDSDIFMGGGKKPINIYFEGSEAEWKKMTYRNGMNFEDDVLGLYYGGYTVHYNSYNAGSSSGSSTTVSAGWQQDKNGWWYRNADGSYAKNQWKQVGGLWYYFDASGYMKTGWISSGGKWYFCDSSGAMKTGWLNTGGKWYYLDSSGAMKTGWQKIGGKWYYMDSSGAMKTGWQKIGGKWYYMNKNGVMQTSWQKIGGKWYYMDNSGVMQAGKWVGDYYLTSNGSMAVSRWIGKYYVGADGKWVKGAVKK